jgi:non-ribosomal peptide synthetase component E (peptide arylation enzyme)
MTDSGETWDFLLDRLAENATKQPTKLAVAFVAPGLNGGKLERQLTYQALAQETSDLATRLLESGITKGER